MTLLPDDLKKAAATEKADMESRVRGPQGGVATYFDVLLMNFLKRAERSEALHAWNTNPKKPPGAEAERAVEELRWLAAYLGNRIQGRLVPHEARVNGDKARGQSDIRSPERSMSQGMAEPLTWRGSPLFKSVFDFAILPMLLWELKPGTVFEIGSGTGASARWLADVIRGFGLDTQVYSSDIKPVAAHYPDVHFMTGDSKSPATLFDVDLLRSAPHPFLVIEDAHVNTCNLFRYLDEFLIAGDYLFVEDSLTKGEDLKTFLNERPNRYLVDTKYTDFFGRNATSALNSILVKV